MFCLLLCHRKEPSKRERHVSSVMWHTRHFPATAMFINVCVFCLQMVWENGCVVIVMLTPLVESGVKQCYHYWPDEGSNLYHIYEVKRLKRFTTRRAETCNNLHCAGLWYSETCQFSPLQLHETVYRFCSNDSLHSTLTSDFLVFFVADSDNLWHLKT